MQSLGVVATLLIDLFIDFDIMGEKCQSKSGCEPKLLIVKKQKF